MMIAIIDPQDEALIPCDWSDIVTGVLSISGDATHFVPDGLIKLSEATDVANNMSFVKVKGAQHGMKYDIEAQATLNNGEILNRNFPVRCFNG